MTARRILVALTPLSRESRSVSGDSAARGNSPFARSSCFAWKPAVPASSRHGSVLLLRAQSVENTDGGASTRCDRVHVNLIHGEEAMTHSLIGLAGRRSW